MRLDAPGSKEAQTGEVRGQGEGKQTGVQLVITGDACFKRCPWIWLAATFLAIMNSAAMRVGV